MLLKSRYLLGAAAITLAVPAMTGIAAAGQDLDAVIARLNKLEKENAKLKSEIKQIEGKSDRAVVTATAAAKTAKTNAGFVEVALKKSGYGAGASADPVSYKDGKAPVPDDDWFFRKKPGKGLTFLTPGGQVQIYGQFDISMDYTTKGIDGMVNPFGGDRPVGNGGWMPALSTNISYIGVRGSQKIDDEYKFVYQLETQIDISATAGTGESNSNQSNSVKGALTSRNSFIGLSSDVWGSIKAGKTDAPYKNSTAMMNPFSGMLGDYASIMGNSGGDNRVEFGTRLDHSLWYESPSIYGLKFAALYSPGQNRASNSDNLASGESDCAGGNNPYSGGGSTCADGAFSDAYSVSATYQGKVGEIGYLITGAYERHQKVNRSSDIDSIHFPALAAADVADEDAAKVGVQLKLPTKTTISGIYESLHRYVPAELQFQNERQRDGTWFAITQAITEKDSFSFGWAHAFATPGDPGVHNTGGGSNPQNQADMLTAALSHTIKPGLTWYIDGAATLNGRDSHYDMGAGGRGVTTDCHDANSSPSSGGGIGAGAQCWAGGTLLGVSTGIKYKF